MKKFSLLMISGLLGSLILSGCGKQNPAAPNMGKANAGTVATQTLLPQGIFYQSFFKGSPGARPITWDDATYDPTWGATIVTRAHGQSSDVTCISAAKWGVVRTYPIFYPPQYPVVRPHIRIYVPSHSASVTWKLGITEVVSPWRHWDVCASTGETGYKDFDCTAIFAQISSTQFRIDIVVEGEIGQSIEVAELYLYDKNITVPSGTLYWNEAFDSAPASTPQHTVGWFDQTTNPGFNCIIESRPNNVGCIVGNPAQWGKVMSPVIPWKAANCQTLEIGIADPGACFSVWIQEQAGQYRQWEVPKTFVGSKFVCDLSGITALSEDTPFAIAIADVYGTMFITGGVSLY